MKSIASLLLIVACSAIAQVPRPDHIVIVIEENHDRSQIIQSYINRVEQAPYIDSLAADIGPSGHTADFTRSFDTGHGYPSQPNYLQFYSGDNQGCINDYFPIAGSPFITANLARELLNTGLTFVAYSENRLGQGYVARHDPSRNWEGNRQTSVSCPRSLTSFLRLCMICIVRRRHHPRSQIYAFPLAINGYAITWTHMFNGVRRTIRSLSLPLTKDTPATVRFAR